MLNLKFPRHWNIIEFHLVAPPFLNLPLQLRVAFHDPTDHSVHELSTGGMDIKEAVGNINTMVAGILDGTLEATAHETVEPSSPVSPPSAAADDSGDDEIPF